MAFKKGMQKIGGKQKGTPNKTTKEIREAFQLLIENNLDNMTQWVKSIANEDPAKAMNLLIQLAEYNIPKLARIETKGEMDVKVEGGLTLNVINPNDVDKINNL